MIAVTGANGLLGNFIIRKLVEQDLPVAAIVRKNSVTDSLSEVREKISWREGDVLNVPALTEALQGAHAVIHTAALVSFNPRLREKIFETNVEGTRNVVNVCLALGIPKVIHVSSVAALGRPKEIPLINEESKWVESSLNSYYAESKYLAELEIYRGMEEGLSVSIVNPSVILAPSDWKKSSAQLFGYVVAEKMFYTEGSINYVDVRDVADMVFAIYNKNLAGQKFIANAGSTPLKNFFEETAKRLGKKAPSVKVRSPWVEIIAWLEELRCLMTGSEPMITRQSVRFAMQSFQYSNQKAKDVLGFKFHTMEETLDWCCREYLRKININK